MPDYNPFSAGVEPAPSATRVRRLVTGLDEQGRSTIVRDDVSPHATVGHGVPTYVVNNLWRTEASPVENAGPVSDPYDTDEPLSVGPTANGSVFRFLELPPDADWRFDADGNEVQPLAYHTTASIDYALVLKGEIWAVLDATEVRMVAGDVMVQRGTAHGWSNRSTSPCLMAFVLIGGTLP